VVVRGARCVSVGVGVLTDTHSLSLSHTQWTVDCPHHLSHTLTHSLSLSHTHTHTQAARSRAWGRRQAAQASSLLPATHAAPGAGVRPPADGGDGTPEGKRDKPGKVPKPSMNGIDGTGLITIHITPRVRRYAKIVP
jgi:hypothetical protein